MEGSETTQINCAPGDTINLKNQGSVTQTYQIDFGEYGAITFDALIGANVSIKCGAKPPTITILETDFKPGVRPVK